MSIAKLTLTVSLWLAVPVIVFSQQEWRNWNSAAVNISFTRKLDLRLNHLRSYNITNNFINNFNQSSASLTYDLTKRLNLMTGFMLTRFPGSGNSTNRYYSRLTHKISLGKIINWTNGIQAEIHSSEETRFHNRFIYITRISNKNRISFLNLNLSATYWLFYNTGGNNIKYYDKTGNVIARHSPDGFHRGRLFLTANSKISKSFSLSLYYVQQQEFNLFSQEQRKINVVNPATGKITRPFDNFNAVGLSLIFDIHLFKSSN